MNQIEPVLKVVKTTQLSSEARLLLIKQLQAEEYITAIVPISPPATLAPVMTASTTAFVTVTVFMPIFAPATPAQQ